MFRAVIILHVCAIATRRSVSGTGLTSLIDQQLHTVPMRSLTPVLTGRNRKAALFVPKEDLEPD